MCFLIKLGRYVSHGERMDPVDFRGQRSNGHTVKRENLAQTYFSALWAGDFLAQTYLSALPVYE